MEDHDGLDVWVCFFVRVGADGVQTEGFAQPDLFGADEDAVVVGGLERVGCVGCGERLEERVACVDGFGGEDAAVDLGVAFAVDVVENARPVYFGIGDVVYAKVFMGEFRC